MGEAVCLTVSGTSEAPGGTHIKILSREDDDFVKLGDISQEIVYPGSFCCSPTMLALQKNLVRGTKNQELYM